jgi:hypothetical protein
MVLLVDSPPPATTLDPPLATASKGQAPTPGAALYVFGGRSGSRLLNDLHRFNLHDMTWYAERDGPYPVLSKFLFLVFYYFFICLYSLLKPNS